MRMTWMGMRTNKGAVDQSQDEIELRLLLSEGLLCHGHRFEGRARDN